MLNHCDMQWLTLEVPNNDGRKAKYLVSVEKSAKKTNYSDNNYGIG